MEVMEKALVLKKSWEIRRSWNNFVKSLWLKPALVSGFCYGLSVRK